MRHAAWVALLLVAPASAAPSPDGNHLALSGALQTSSARVVSSDPGCGTGVRRGAFIFESGAMTLGSGPAVARVSFELRHFAGPGVYSAREPRVDYRRTPLQVVTARNASRGAGSNWFLARRGTIRVKSMRKIGRRAFRVEGSVSAVLVDESGRHTRLRGTWRCRFER